MYVHLCGVIFCSNRDFVIVSLCNHKIASYRYHLYKKASYISAIFTQISESIKYSFDVSGHVVARSRLITNTIKTSNDSMHITIYVYIFYCCSCEMKILLKIGIRWIVLMCIKIHDKFNFSNVSSVHGCLHYHLM